MILIKHCHFQSAVVILLCIITVSFFNGFPRYQEVGSELLANADFNGNLAQWTASGERVELIGGTDGGIKLSANDAGRSSSLSQVIDLPYNGGLLLRLSCDIKTEHLVDGERSWDTGRVVLLSLNDAGKAMYDRPHILTQQNGSHDWTHVERVFAIGSDVSRLELAAQLNRSTGELWVRSFSLRPVMMTETFVHYRLLLLYVWVSIASWTVTFFVRSSLKSVAHGAVLLLSVGIILGVLMPNGIKESLGAAIRQDEVASRISILPGHINDVNDAQFFKLTPNLPNPDLFKAGHFIMFALLTITLVTARPYKLSTNKLVFYLCLFAGVSEVSQLFMPGRSAQLGDIAIDCGGIATGLILSGLGQLYINRVYCKQ